MKDLLKVLALMALLVIAGFQTCSNSKSAASPGANKSGIKVNNDLYNTTLNRPVALNVLANDSITIENSTVVFGAPVHGTIVHNPNGSGFSYVPKKDFKGRDTFEYRVCLGEACETASVRLQVN